MKKYFSVKFNQHEIILPKSSVVFNDSLGIFKAIYDVDFQDYAVRELLIGLVDQNYNLILLAREYMIPKLEILSDNIILKYKENMNDVYSVYSAFIADNKFSFKHDLCAEDFSVIDEKTIMLKSRIDETPIMALYDVLKCEPITPYFNFIGEFKDNLKYNEVVAEASVFIYDSNNRMINRIVCFISKGGEVISNYYNTLTQEEYDKTMSLIEVIECVKEYGDFYTR